MNFLATIFILWGFSTTLLAADLEAARAALARGDFALAAQLAAKDVPDSAADPAGAIEAALIRGEALAGAGFLGESLQALRAALDVATKANREADRARALLVLSSVERPVAGIERALQSAAEAREIAARLGLAGLEARALLNEGILLASGDPVAAARRFESAAAQAERAQDGETGVLARINLARLQMAAARHAEALRAIEDAHARARALPEGYARLRALVAIGALALAAEAGPAESTLQEAAALAERMQAVRMHSFALGYLAELRAREGRPDEALELNRRAILAAYPAGAADALYRWYWQRGRLLARAGGGPGGGSPVLESYRRAVHYLQALRADVDSDLIAGEGGFLQGPGRLYREAADLLLREGESAQGEESRSALLREARAVLEASKAAELQDYFRDDCVGRQREVVARLDQIEVDATIIYPVLLADRLVLLVSRGERVVQVVVQVSAEQVSAEIRGLRERLERRSTRQYLPFARRLHDLLIAPAQAAITQFGSDTLVFVPDGPLRTIPLAALHDGKSFLVERYAVAVTPGLSLTDPRPLAQRRLRVLVGGLTQPVQGFASLPNVAQELDSIREEFGARVLQDDAFVIPALERELDARQYSVVHIASHGQFDRDPANTFLLSYDGKLGMNALERLIAPTRLREQPIELLALSACQTATGDDRAALGLAGVAIKAGARSALASLWFINDESTTLLIGEFYRRLKVPGTTKARALQQAQRALMADRRFAHPAYWAPFLLIGNWL